MGKIIDEENKIEFDIQKFLNEDCKEEHGSIQEKNVGWCGIEMKIKIERCFNCNHHVITLVTKRWEEYECWKCGCGCMTIHRNVRNSEIKENEDETN